jgi:hypothetical protein
MVFQTDRLASRKLGDLTEKPQYQIGIQIDLGTIAQITLESVVIRAMRWPFPVMQKTATASLKVKANDSITFSLGAVRKTLDARNTTRMGLNVWFTGKSHNLGVGFQFGQDQTPWGSTWKIQ